jgi:hypothetical protein
MVSKWCLKISVSGGKCNTKDFRNQVFDINNDCLCTVSYHFMLIFVVSSGTQRKSVTCLIISKLQTFLFFGVNKVSIFDLIWQRVCQSAFADFRLS